MTEDWQTTHGAEQAILASDSQEDGPALDETDRLQPQGVGLAARRFGLMVATLAALAACGAAALAFRKGGEPEQIPAASPDVAGVISQVGTGGGRSDFQDFIVGAIPKYEDAAAHYGTPPMPPGPRQSSAKKMPGCPGTSCNDGKLCCAAGDKCCGTSCCSKGSTCCNAKLGMCCAEGDMCCFGKACCANGFACGQTRDFSDGLRYEVLKQCGSGGQIRRLSGQLAYKSQMRNLMDANVTEFERLWSEQA
mmetsp:Transcript_109071/g.315126  ORF Transcript_109071/g.315126 Transcript_109071/m.315126 type:complete len:250 (-) Transcript_109071:136-885(-)